MELVTALKGIIGACQKVYTFEVTPVAKPRMTQRDKWDTRPAVVKYWDYKDKLQVFVKQQRYVLGESLLIVFHLPMPKSWSKVKRKRMACTPHKQIPDTDNLVKAFKDALLTEDKEVYAEVALKYWSEEDDVVGRVMVYEEIEREASDIVKIYR